VSASLVLHLITSHLLSIVGFVMAALLAADVLRNQQRPPATTFAWLLAIVLVPYVGVPLYLVFGGRKVARMAARKASLYGAAPDGRAGASDLERMLCGLGAPPARAGNSVELLVTGEQAYQAVVEAIDGATRSIEIATLILADDEVGRAVIERLVVRARAGVTVRVLIDGLFAFRSSRRHLAALADAGGQIARFMPVLHLPSRRSHANLRMHRKIVAVDERVAIVGGMNIAREYMGPTPLATRWRDLSARLRGPAVTDLVAVFRSDWAFAAGAAAPPPVAPAPAAAGGASMLQVVGSGPDVAADLLYDAFLTGVFQARRRLWIATPYFVPDEALTRALVLAARRGVDVRIIAPAQSNHRIADLAGAGALRQVAAAGVRVLPFGPGMLHAKLVMIDDQAAILGSANFDMRSFFLDYEIGLFCWSLADIAGLGAWFEETSRHTVQLPAAGRPRILAEQLARLVGPLT
jgi:cardiolipin synthase